MHKRILLPGVILLLLISPITALANNGLPITVMPSKGECGAVTFEVNFPGAGSTYDLYWVFGDGQSDEEMALTDFPHSLEYTYNSAGDYEWSVSVIDSNNPGLTGFASGSITIGPSVTLVSDPMPPFLELNGGVASANFTANVEGGKAPLTYAWSMEGAFSLLLGSEQNSITASYSAAGEYTASVTVTDACDYSDTDTLTVVVIDTVIPSCHPTAQRIAEAVNTLFPDQAEQLYTCEDIYNIFLGDLTGSHTGFGRLWHAYKLAATIEELTWEQIRDWQLDGSGWGILVQLDKFADALDEVSIIDLMDKVTSGENTVNQIRTALRNVLRYEADFEDALTRLAEGASPGSLGQFYRVAQELGISPEELDGYLEQGMDISELRHAAKLASQTDTDWMDLALAHSEGYSWGEIKQALHMADEDTDVMDLLGLGVKEVRQQQRDETRNEQADDRDLQTAAKIAEQYGSTESEVMAMYEGDCATDWSCVRKHFREAAENGKIDQDQSTATRLASQHGVDEDEVWSLFEGTCAGDWKCVRTELRNQTRGSRGKGKD